MAIPAAPAAAGSGGTAGASADAVRRVKGGMLDRLFQDNVMELLLLLAQHAQQASDHWVEQTISRYRRRRHRRCCCCMRSMRRQ